MSKKDIIDYVMETPGNTNKKVLGRLIDEVEGAKLPEVTEDDNGSVLTVVEGAWDKAEPSGGGFSIPVLTLSATEDENIYEVDGITKEDLENGNVFPIYEANFPNDNVRYFYLLQEYGQGYIKLYPEMYVASDYVSVARISIGTIDEGDKVYMSYIYDTYPESS